MTTYILKELTPDELAALERYRKERDSDNEYTPWVELGITETQYYKRRYLEMSNENARLTAEVEAAWIPVTERLPDERGYYLAAGKWFTDKNWITLLYFDDDQEWYSGQSVRRSTTHWRPLPAHPDAARVQAAAPGTGEA